MSHNINWKPAVCWRVSVRIPCHLLKESKYHFIWIKQILLSGTRYTL